MKEFTTKDLFLIEELSSKAEDSEIQELNTKVRKILDLSVNVGIDPSIDNLVRRVVHYIAISLGREDLYVTKKWKKFLAKQMTRFVEENPNIITEEFVKLLGSGDAKKVLELYPDIRYYSEIRTAFSMMLRYPEPPRDIRFTDFIVCVIILVGYFIDGRFGKKKKLKPALRFVWRLITYGTITTLFLKYIMFPIFEKWESVVAGLNILAWG